MSLENPFTPLFGQVPIFVAGRDVFLSEMGQAFIGQSNNPNLSTLIVGPRGTGKTVLLSRIAELAEQAGWIVARVSSCEGMLEDILQRAYETGSHLLESPAKNRLTGLEVGGILGASWDKNAVNANWRTKMNRIFEQLSLHDTGLLITVDEVNASCAELITLATTYQHFLSEGKRVSLVMAGLPGNVSGLVNGKLTSFWRRARQQHLERIPDDAVSAALQKTLDASGVKIEERALELAVQKIDGFAYLLQLVGYWAFEDMRKSGGAQNTLSICNVQEGVNVAEEDMRNSVLSSTFADLSEGDVVFLCAMLQSSGSSNMRDIAERMGVTQSYASQYRLRLISQGVVGSRGRGKLDFEIPFFREYVQEVTGGACWPGGILGGDVPAENWQLACSFAEEFSKIDSEHKASARGSAASKEIEGAQRGSAGGA